MGEILVFLASLFDRCPTQIWRGSAPGDILQRLAWKPIDPFMLPETGSYMAFVASLKTVNGSRVGETGLFWGGGGGGERGRERWQGSVMDVDEG